MYKKLKQTGNMWEVCKSRSITPMWYVCKSRSIMAMLLKKLKQTKKSVVKKQEPTGEHGVEAYGIKFL